jgi:hypothetical protein
MRACKRLGHVRAYNGAAETRTAAHLVCLGETSLSDGGPALCGEWAASDDVPSGVWRGLREEELDVAKVLPLCPKCAKAVKFPAST